MDRNIVQNSRILVTIFLVKAVTNVCGSIDSTLKLT